MSITSWRIIPEIDKNPRLVALAQTTAGRIALILCFAFVLQALAQSPLLAALAGACAFAGRYRWHLIPVLTLIVLCRNGFATSESILGSVAAQEGIATAPYAQLLLGTLAAAFFLFSCLIHFWRRIIGIRLFLRSTLLMIIGFLTLVAVGQSPICRGESRVVLWSFLTVFASYFWFLAYALGDIGSGERGPVLRYLGIFRPFWSASTVPFGLRHSHNLLAAVTTL